MSITNSYELMIQPLEHDTHNMVHRSLVNHVEVISIWINHIITSSFEQKKMR